jgi:hypothetical protein
MEMPAEPGRPGRLNGWKEIADYLGRSLRTVQRYERELNLPVRRLRRNRGDVVYALRHEIDAWYVGVGPLPPATSDGEPDSANHRAARASATPDTVATAPSPGSAAGPWRARWKAPGLAAAVLGILVIGGLLLGSDYPGRITLKGRRNLGIGASRTPRFASPT